MTGRPQLMSFSRATTALGAVALYAALAMGAMPAQAAAIGGQSDSQQAQPAPASTTMSDAQIESNVLRALAGSKNLANQQISSSTVFGTVTLTGSVNDAASQELAETIVSRVPGVKKVVDNMTVGGSGADSTVVGAQSQQAQDDAADSQEQQAQQPEQPQDQSDDMAEDAPTPPPADQPYPQQARQPYVRPDSGNAYYGGQAGGEQVMVPAGSMLRVRIEQELDSKHVQPGMAFRATALNDVVSAGNVAIPRGATLTGTVVDAKPAGVLKGEGKLALQLTSLTLGGQTYPIASDIWTNYGPNKTSQTVGSAAGLGAVGAIIGAIAGGGPGAAIGAVAGGAAGVGASAANGGSQAYIPAEGIVTFHLQQPVAVTTVSQAELNRLASNAPASAGRTPYLHRRYAYYGYPYPPPPPYYYRYYGYYGRPYGWW